MQVGQDKGVSDGTQFGAQPGLTAPLQLLVAPVGKARMPTLVALMFAVRRARFTLDKTPSQAERQAQMGMRDATLPVALAILNAYAVLVPFKESVGEYQLQ